MYLHRKNKNVQVYNLNVSMKVQEKSNSSKQVSKGYLNVTCHSIKTIFPPSRRSNKYFMMIYYHSFMNIFIQHQTLTYIVSKPK